MRTPVGSSKRMARSAVQNSPVRAPSGVTFTVWARADEAPSKQARRNSERDRLDLKALIGAAPLHEGIRRIPARWHDTQSTRGLDILEPGRSPSCSRFSAQYCGPAPPLRDRSVLVIDDVVRNSSPCIPARAGPAR